eukprot:22968-Chlamydomonas_euryale.AAC.6
MAVAVAAATRKMPRLAALVGATLPQRTRVLTAQVVRTSVRRPGAAPARQPTPSSLPRRTSPPPAPPPRRAAPPAPLRLILELAQPLRLGYGAGPRGRDHGRHSSDHALVRPRSVQTVVSPLQAAATSKPGAPRSRRAPVLRDRGHVHAAAAARCWRTDRPALRSLAMPPLSGLPRHC